MSGATIGSLTLANYETRTDGNIFDGYEMSKLFEALTGQANATIATVESLPAMTSNDIRTANGGNNIVVQIAGKSWYATYLSKSGNDSILTLWRTAPDFKAAFAPYSSGSISSNYPSAMYGMSKMRSVELNNGGDYAHSPSGTSDGFQSSTHTYAVFTMPGVAGSLTDYIVTPAAMAWQATVSNKISNSSSANLSNDAYSTTMPNMVSTNYQKKAGYDTWKNDRLWLVAQAEIGSAGYAGGFWKTDNVMLGNRTSDENLWWWERSAGSNSPDTVHNQNSSGVVVTKSLGVRPAFHLNISKIGREITLDAPEVPAGTVYTYNGLEQTIDIGTYTDYDADKMYVTNIVKNDPTAGTVAPSIDTTEVDVTKRSKIKLTDAGTYKVTLKTKSPISGSSDPYYYFADTGTDETVVTIEVKKKQLTKPSITTSAGNKDYNGTELIFNLPNYPSDTVPATGSSAYPKDPLSASIERKVDGAVSAPVYAPKKEEKADGTLDITVRDAGDYTTTVKIEDKVNYEWADGTQSDTTVGFKVKEKELGITYTTDDPSWTSGNLSWSADKSYKATFTVSGVYNGDASAVPAVSGDNVGIVLKITKSGESTATGSVTAVSNGDGTYTAELDSSVFPDSKYAVGVYAIEFELDGTGTDNGNYKLPATIGGISNLTLTISAAAVSFTPQWQYTKGTGTAQNVPSDNKFKYEYDGLTNAGVVYTILLDQSTFAANHISIDTSKYNQGIQNGQASNAGTYTTTVALKAEAGYALPNGQATMDVTYSWEIEKGDIDLSQVKWQYTTTQGNIPSSPKNYPVQWNVTTKAWEYLDADGNVAGSDAGLPWYGEQYTLSITGFPTGVTINNPANAYNGTNKKKFVGSYTTECVGISYDTANYNALPGDVLKLNWQIVKAKIEITSTSWSTQQEGGTAEGVSIFYVPVLQNVAGVEYEYWDLGTAADPKDPAELLGSIGDITSVSGTEHKYFVKAKVKSGVSIDGTTLWEDAIELVDKTNPPNGDCTKEFTTGDSRTPVQVTLNGAPYTYDGKAHAILDDGSNNGELSIQIAGTNNNFAVSNFDVTYYEHNGSSSTTITDCFDAANPLSGAAKDAGKYIIVIQLKTAAEENYYLTAKYVEYEIKPYQLDLSQVKWGYLGRDENGEEIEIEYNPTSPLQYEKDESGAVKEHELILIGLPKGDAEGDADAKLLAEMYAESGLGSGLLSYSGNKNGAVGTYKAECSIGSLSENFVFSNIPGFINVDGDNKPTNSEQSWKVEPRKVETPKSDNTHSFTGEVLDILTYVGLDPAGLGLYYTITGLTKRDENNEAKSVFTSENCADPRNPTTEEIKAVLGTIKDAGRYGISIGLVDAPNTQFNENGAIGTLPTYTAQVTVNKLKVTVSGWQGDGNAPWQASVDPAGFTENRYENEAGEVVKAEELINHYNEQFKQQVVASAGNEENIEIVYAEGVEEEKVFFMLDQGNPPDPIEKPGTLSEGGRTYDGSAQSFLPEGLEELIEKNRVKLYAVDEEGNETEVGTEYFTQKNAGKYKVLVKISGNYYWEGTNNDKTPIEYEYEIGKAEISGEWGTDEKGMPILTGVSEKFADKLVYEYRDAEGKVVAEEDLTKGKEYTVSVRVSEEESGNIILRTESGEEAESLESMFTVPGRNTLANMIGLPEDFPLIQVALTVIFLILFLIFLIMWIRYHKQRKAAEEIIEEYQNLDL